MILTETYSVYFARKYVCISQKILIGIHQDQQLNYKIPLPPKKTDKKWKNEKQNKNNNNNKKPLYCDKYLMLYNEDLFLHFLKYFVARCRSGL